ncbi:MAG: C45 family autoproteolytic acyltransferase/hydrolase [Saccharospirillum sp.]
MTQTFNGPRTLSGSAYVRGVAQASDPAVTEEQIFQAVIAPVRQAEQDGLLNKAARRFLKEQLAYNQSHVPLSLEEVQGIGRGFNLDFDDLFAYLHLGTLRDLNNSNPSQMDGCSAWATLNTDLGATVVKNRDFTGQHVDVQRLTVHRGPDIRSGTMLCLGSLGAPGAYSSGINASGLAIADTQIGTRRHGVGVLRYFLMTELLRQCDSVEAALSWINRHHHAGGGSLILADPETVAAVELGMTEVAIERGETVYRTNHFTSSALAETTLHRHGYGIDENSTRRFQYLAATLPGRTWPLAGIQQLMASHASGDQDAPICQHPDNSGSQTLSSILFQCQTRRAYYLAGNPCSGQWHCVDWLSDSA